MLYVKKTEKVCTFAKNICSDFPKAIYTRLADTTHALDDNGIAN